MEKQMNIKRALFALLSAMLLPAMAFAQPVIINPAEGTAVFVVQKIFEDGNDETDVTLHMFCNSGNPTEQSLTVTPDNGVFNGTFEVAFVLDNIPQERNEAIICTIEETPIGGYQGYYSCGGASDSDPDESCDVPLGTLGDEVECRWSDVDEGDVNYCIIRNVPNTAEFSITKEWVVEGAGGNLLDFEARMAIRSTAYFTNSHECKGNSNQFCSWVTFDNGPASETQTFTIYPGFEGASIYVEEKIWDSSFDSDNDCGGSMSVMPEGYEGASGEDSCTFTNTAFFEGIPTLNQYGMAIMALLMLGVGFIGFRRFV
jgi:hypothetical protein